MGFVMNSVALATIIDKHNHEFNIILDHAYCYKEELIGLASNINVVDIPNGYHIFPDNIDNCPTIILIRNSCHIQSRFKNTVYK